MTPPENFKLFNVIRQACAAPVWSQGAKLVRENAVHGISEDEDEIVLRVRVQGFVVDPTVVLYPADEDWECDCREKTDNCSHVAAAAIAVNQARQQGQRLPRSSAGEDQLVYRFPAHRGDCCWNGSHCPVVASSCCGHR